MSDIFISFDSRDLDRIKPLAIALETKGWSVFYDRTILPGKTWRQVIDKELTECRCMVVGWSNNVIDSHWVLEEADDGLKRNILVPFFIDQVIPPLGHRSIQAANLVNWKGEQDTSGFLTLCQAIIGLLGPSKTAAKDFLEAPVPRVTQSKADELLETDGTRVDHRASKSEDVGTRNKLKMILSVTNNVKLTQ